MTSSQLREILKSNILTLSTISAEEPEQWEDYVQSGAHILLAPACNHMDDEEAALIDNLLEVASDKAFVAGQLVTPDQDFYEDDRFDYDGYYETIFNRAGWLSDMGVSMIFITGFADILTTQIYGNLSPKQEEYINDIKVLLPNGEIKQLSQYSPIIKSLQSSSYKALERIYYFEA